MDLTFIKLTYLQLLSIAYLIVTMVKYRKKKKVMTLENYVYSAILFFVLSGLVTEVLYIWTVNIYPNVLINTILDKISMSFTIATLISLCLYLSVITSNKNQGYIAYKDNKEAPYFNKVIYRYFILMIVLIAITAILNVEVVPIDKNGDLFKLDGYGKDFLFVIYSGVFAFIAELIYLCRKKGINDKLFPFAVFIILAILALALERTTNIAISIVGFASTISIIFLNFTIENPDLNVIEQLNIAKTQADKANRAKTDFLSSMSHEIRTPLNAIVGFSNALKEEQISNEAMEEVDDIIVSARNLLEVVNNILDISKIDAGRIEITPLEYNTKKMVKNIISYAEEKIDQTKIKFVINVDPDLPPVLYGDSVRIKQCVQNLISNSSKYTKEGTITVNIKSICLNSNCRLYISVIDSGSGIKEEDKFKIFNKFNNNDSSKEKNADGSGLGLSITKRLLDMMDGTVDFQTEEGKGTKFLITINQKIVNKTVDEIDDIDDTEIKIFNASNKRILIVDDNAVNLKVAKKLLKDFNNEPDLLQSAKECIDKIRNGEKYDLIFIDDMMPSMTGSEAITFLRRIPNYNIPTVILTANQTPGIKEKYVQIGFDDYLAKPILKEQLAAILNKFLNSKEEYKRNNEISVAAQEEIKKAELAIPTTPIEEQIPSNVNNKEFLNKNGVNVTHALDLLMDIQTYNQGLKEFVSEYSDRSKRISDAVSNNDIDAYYKEVHIIKSDSKYLGFTRLFEIATTHDSEAEKKKTTYVFENYNELLDEYARIYGVVKEYLGL